MTGERSDGYHDIDTLVAFATIADRIRIREACAQTVTMTLEVTGPFSNVLGENGDNLVIRAAKAFKLLAGNAAKRPVDLKLEKNLPVASGIGGGSADAAATLLGLARFHGLENEFDLASIAEGLGADVSMCLISRMLRARGTGTKIQILENSARFPAILVNPGIAVSTPSVFNALEEKANPAIDFGVDGPEASVLQAMRNDLETPAMALAPLIADVLKLIGSCPECQLSRMSGSGATCFGLFPSVQAAHGAAEIVKKVRPDWWCVETVLGSYEDDKRVNTIQCEAK